MMCPVVFGGSNYNKRSYLDFLTIASVWGIFRGDKLLRKKRFRHWV